MFVFKQTCAKHLIWRSPKISVNFLLMKLKLSVGQQKRAKDYENPEVSSFSALYWPNQLSLYSRGTSKTVKISIFLTKCGHDLFLIFQTLLSYSTKIRAWKQNETEYYKPKIKVKESSNIKVILHENQMQGSRIAGDQGGKVRIHLILEENPSHGLQNLPS